MSCMNTTVLNAPVDRVWTALRDFHDMSWAANVITDLTPVGEASGTEVGAGRILNGAFHETLRSLDDDARTLTYSIDDGPGPLAPGEVVGYRGELRVLPVTVGPEACSSSPPLVEERP